MAYVVPRINPTDDPPPKGYVVPRTNPSKPMAKSKPKKKSTKRVPTGNKTIRVGSWVADEDERLYLVTHLSDTTVAGRNSDGITKNVPIERVRIVKQPLRSGMKVRRGKQDFTVVIQSHADAVLLKPVGGGEEIEVAPGGLKVTSQGRYTKGSPQSSAPAHTPAAKTQATPPRSTADDKHDMTPVYALHGSGESDVIGYAWTAAEANKLLSRFKMHGPARKTVINGDERVYVGPVGETQAQLDRAKYTLQKQGVRDNPAGRKTNVKKNPSSKVPPPSRAMVEKLTHWHASMGDPVYAVSSSWYAGHVVDVDVVDRAVASLKRANPDTAKDRRERDQLVSALEKLVEKHSPRENPVRTKAGRVLVAKGSRRLASKLLRMRKEAIERGEEPPQRIPRPGGGWMTYESASYVLGHGNTSGKTGSRPRKARETSGRRSGGSSGGGADAVTYINQNFGLG